MSNSNNAIAVIGEKDICKIFNAVGYDCFYETTSEDLIKRCQTLTKADYKIILILEKEAQKIQSYLDSRAGIAYPIILPIPDTVTNSNYGMQRLNQNMEKAMGMKLGGKS